MIDVGCRCADYLGERDCKTEVVFDKVERWRYLDQVRVSF